MRLPLASALLRCLLALLLGALLSACGDKPGNEPAAVQAAAPQESAPTPGAQPPQEQSAPTNGAADQADIPPAQTAPQAPASAAADTGVKPITLRARAEAGANILDQGLAWTVRRVDNGQVVHQSKDSGSITVELPPGMYDVDVVRSADQAQAGGEINTAEGDRFTLTLEPAGAQTAAAAPPPPPSSAAPATVVAAPTAASAGRFQPDEEKLEAAQSKLEAAQASGDPAAVQLAMKELMQAQYGPGEALKPQQLRELMPEEIAGLARGSVKTSSQSTMGLQMSELDATYGKDGQTVRVHIKDMGPAGGALSGMRAAMMGGTSETEDDESVERSYREGDLLISESYQKDGSRSELQIYTPGGVELNAKGAMPMDKLKPAMLALTQQLQAAPRTDQ